MGYNKGGGRHLDPTKITGVKGVSITRDHLGTTVKYHDTNIVVFDERRIILNTGGFKTYWTKMNMNRTAREFGLDFRVFQQGTDGTGEPRWFVEFGGKEQPFDTTRLVLARITDRDRSIAEQLGVGHDGAS